MTIREQLSTWAGFQGGPGTTVMYSTDASGFSGPLGTFWTAVAGQLPDSVNVTVAATGKVIEETTGKATGTFDDGISTVHTGQIDDHYASFTGAVIAWHTGAFVNGREVIGKTYLIPAPASIFDQTGRILQAAASAYKDAANGLIVNSGQRLVVWSRPFEGRAAQGTPGQPGYKPAIPERLGSSHKVISATCHIQGSMLKRRRANF